MKGIIITTSIGTEIEDMIREKIEGATEIEAAVVVAVVAEVEVEVEIATGEIIGQRGMMGGVEVIIIMSGSGVGGTVVEAPIGEGIAEIAVEAIPAEMLQVLRGDASRKERQ